MSVLLLFYYHCITGLHSIPTTVTIIIKINYSCIIILHTIILLSLSVSVAIMLTPAEPAYVCPRQQITFTCETNDNFLRWNVTFLDSGYTDERLVSSYGVPDIVSLKINAILFNFTRISEAPLMVTMSVSNVTTDLRIRCKEYTESSIVNTLSTMIFVVSAENEKGNPLLDYPMAYM